MKVAVGADVFVVVVEADVVVGLADELLLVDHGDHELVV